MKSQIENCVIEILFAAQYKFTCLAGEFFYKVEDKKMLVLEGDKWINTTMLLNTLELLDTRGRGVLTII